MSYLCEQYWTKNIYVYEHNFFIYFCLISSLLNNVAAQRESAITIYRVPHCRTMLSQANLHTHQSGLCGLTLCSSLRQNPCQKSLSIFHFLVKKPEGYFTTPELRTINKKLK